MASVAPEDQSLTAKKAEARRPHHGDSVLRDPSLNAMHRERAQAILHDARDLSRRGVSFDPFLEIGAGSVQRSIALMHGAPSEGLATDISQESLRDAPYILQLLGHDRLPVRVSCDAHHLPLLSNTFAFVFAYQALHHFSNPAPVIAECHRVLGRGGHFFFNEEPLDSWLRRLLRGERVLAHPPTPIQRLGYRFGVEKIFWDDGAHERALGMTEARFDIDLWRTALQPFEILEFEVNRKLRLRSNLRTPAWAVALSGFAGGNARGLCVKRDGHPPARDLRERFVCLDCSAPLALPAPPSALACAGCGRIYPCADGVLRMLPRELEETLHGERRRPGHVATT